MKEKIGIIAPSLIRNPSGGLEQQVSYLIDLLEDEFEFNYYYESKNLEKTIFQVLKDINNGVKAFILFFSWDEADFWLDVFTRIPNIPIIYSERSDPILVVSRWDYSRRMQLLKRANIIHQFYPEYATKKYNPFHEKTFFLKNTCFKFPEVNPRFLYVGSINSYPKKTDYLLEIISEYPKYQLEVCGTGDQNIITRFSEYKNIHFLGQLSNEELAHQYRLASALICPSKYEGCPNCVLEANQFGLPIIGCADGVRLTARNNKYVFHDSNNLEKVINQFVQDNFLQDNITQEEIKKVWIDQIRKLIK